jgi:hypothetical protein
MLGKAIWMCMGLGFGAVGAQNLDQNVAVPAETRAEYNTGSNPFIEHAPLAFFSLGSLAVGAVFYGIQSTMGEGRVQGMVGDKSQMNAAVAAAGVSALVSAATYLYYAHRDARRARGLEAASLSGGIAPDGSMRLAASLRLPVSLGL